MRARFFWVAAGLVWVAGCTHHHQAKVATADVPPPPGAMVTHSSKLWIVLAPQTPSRQCVQADGERKLCFAGVDDALGRTLERTLWPAFPGVALKRKGDNLRPSDYVLIVELALDAVASDEKGPGWSAGAHGSWRLVRDGIPLAGETLASRSRADFPYGRTLGIGAGEVVDAIAVHIATTVGKLPETRPLPGVPLPAVASERRFGVLTAISERSAIRAEVTGTRNP